MSKYILRRLFSGILTILMVFVLDFIIIKAAPGDPVRTIMGKETDDPELRAALMEKYGLDKPLHVQFVSQLKPTKKYAAGRFRKLYHLQPLGS